HNLGQASRAYPINNGFFLRITLHLRTSSGDTQWSSWTERPKFKGLEPPSLRYAACATNTARKEGDMTEIKLNIWPTHGWQLFEIEGHKLMALSLVLRSNPQNRAEVSNSQAFAMSPQQMRALAADLTKAADLMGSRDSPATEPGRH
ncbi:hypothetical protein ACFVHT_18095, partial [Bacillus subtilis]